MSFRIVPVPSTVVAESRATRKSPGYGHPVYEDVATGYGPCRSCLNPLERRTDVRLLVTYDPFMDIESLPLPGPIYLHASPCEPYLDDDRYPEQLRFIPTTLNAYGRGRQLREVRYIEPNGNAESAIAELLAIVEVDYIHARNTEAGCYMFRIERP